MVETDGDGERAKVLVVDDDPCLLMIRARVLKKEGYRVCRAATGADALVLAEREKPALALVDRVLNDLDGIDVCERLKRNPSLSGMIVVITSGLKTQIEDQVDGLERGADGYITLPISNRELVARVEAFLRLAQPGPSLRRQAEERVRRRGSHPTRRESGNVDELLHELDVHQTELEMQNREMRLSQRKLEQARTHYFRLFHNAPVGYLALDEKAAIHQANMTFAEMLGRDVAELHSATFAELVAPEDREVFLGRFRAFHRSTRGKAMKLRLQRREGKELYVSLHGAKLGVGPTDRSGAGLDNLVHITVTDISAQVDVEQALRRSETRLLRAQRIARLADAVFDFDAGEVVLSETFGELLGVELTDSLPLEQLVEEIIHPDDRSRLSAWLQDGQTPPARSLPALEMRALRPDNSLLHLRAEGSVELQNGGQTVLFATLQDVTERKKLQNQLAQADRLSTVGLLAAGVAHEITNPLAYVLHNLERIKTELSETLASGEPHSAGGSNGANPLLNGPEEKRLVGLRQGCDAALKGTERVREIVTGLSAFSREGRKDVEAVSVASCLDAAASMAANEIKYRAVLVKDYADTPAVAASEGRLCQVFLNLLVNAAQSITEGNVEANEIRIKTWVEGEDVCVRVADTGCGIGSEHLDSLFEPFFTTKPLGVGSGLGLAISKNIVEGYRGSLNVASEAGKGSVFTVRLPACQDEERTQPPSEPPSLDEYAGARVLIVDDEAFMRETIVDMLSDHETIEAGNGAEAKAILENDQAFDAIVCDMMMPNVSGTELHAWLRGRHPSLADRLVFITGGAFTSNAQRYLREVENVRLQKPFRRTELLHVIRELAGHAGRGDRTSASVSPPTGAE